MDNQSNRFEGDFDFGVKIDQSKEEKSQHSQSSEDLVENFKHKRGTSILGLRIKLSFI